jgi:hypothetical protein
MGSGYGGWVLHVVCTTCGAEDQYKGVVMALAADAAERDGWVIDREALHAPATERYATCPLH